MNDGVAILLTLAGYGLLCFGTGWKVHQHAQRKSLSDNDVPPLSSNPVRRLRRVLSESEIARIEQAQVWSGVRHRVPSDNDPGEGFYRDADDRF